MKTLAILAAALALQACAVLPNKPALRAAVIGVGSALVIGAARTHDDPTQPHTQRVTPPSCNTQPEVCR